MREWPLAENLSPFGNRRKAVQPIELNGKSASHLCATIDDNVLLDSIGSKGCRRFPC
eukprot:SAG31_NODE_47140_length_251_cov_1.026316_2_plen_56_part_01